MKNKRIPLFRSGTTFREVLLLFLLVSILPQALSVSHVAYLLWTGQKYYAGEGESMMISTILGTCLMYPLGMVTAIFFGLSIARRLDSRLWRFLTPLLLFLAFSVFYYLCICFVFSNMDALGMRET